MNFSGLPPDQSDESGAQWTMQEIAQQPDVWLKTERSMARDVGAARTFLEPLLSRKDLQIVLTGAGTSACIGECLAPSLTRRFGMRVHVISTTDLVAAPDSWLAAQAPLLLVSFARSGNSPESVAAMALAEQISPDCHHLIITCNRGGELYRRGNSSRNAHVVLLPEETNDRGFAMTSSFSTMLLSAALTFGLLNRESPAILARWASQVLAGFPGFASLANTEVERVVYLGSNEFNGLAREAALKMLELTDGRVVAVSETPLGFRHGPKTFLNARTMVIMFLSNNPYTRVYEVDLLNELRSDGIASRVIALRADTAVAESPNEFRIQGASAAADLDLCFPYAVFAQSLALRRSLALGLRPDTPNVSGVVHRVVQGVSVYRWDPRP
jgi:tagatose-6-phosphate ketose/aldose isomerase